MQNSIQGLQSQLVQLKKISMSSAHRRLHILFIYDSVKTLLSPVQH